MGAMYRSSSAFVPMFALALGLQGCSDPGGAEGGGSTASSDSSSTSASTPEASTSSTGSTSASGSGSMSGIVSTGLDSADDSSTGAGSTTASGWTTSSGDMDTTDDGDESSSDSASAECLYATWNPADAQPNIVFSGGDLEVTVLTDTLNETARATQGKTTGRWYWEVYDDVAGTGGFNAVCVADSDLSLEVAPCWAGYPGFNHPRSGSTCWGGGLMGSGPSFGPGDVVGVALDADTNEAWLHVDGTWFPNPPDGGPGMSLGVAAPGGWFPCINLSRGDVFSASFGQDPFVYPVPMGFAEGVYDGEGEGCGSDRPPPPPPPA